MLPRMKHRAAAEWLRPELAGAPDDVLLAALGPNRLQPGAWTVGPGTELHALLGELGIEATADCQCRARAMEMNVRGLEWCVENLDLIVGWLRESRGRVATVRRRPLADLCARYPRVTGRAMGELVVAGWRWITSAGRRKPWDEVGARWLVRVAIERARAGQKVP